MKYREASFYGFGLSAGLKSFLRNGLGPGFRVTASSILQPVNSYTRFPEFHFLEHRIAALASGAAGRSLSVLDVGSPKILGLVLAYRHPLEVRMTDIDAANVEPYALIWKALARRARGTACFGALDVRRLDRPDGTYDVVYAVSVLEHVEGAGRDRGAVLEMARVLKPKGWLFLSVPFGPLYQEQWARGIVHAGRRTPRSEVHFFQRIYDRRRLEDRILGPLRDLADDLEIVTAYRRTSRTLRVVQALRGGLPEGVVAALGALNPLLSLVLNRHGEGLVDGVPTRYGRLHHFGDIFAEVIVAARKKGVGKGEVR